MRRVAGACALLAAACFFGGGAVEGGALPDRAGPFLIVAQNLLLIPSALYLWRVLERVHRAAATVAAVAGVASLLLWAAAPVTGAWHLEPLWIGLSAVWWIGTGVLLRPFRHGWGTFTIVLGVAALLDAVVTAFEDVLPFFVFAFLGGPKLPLSLVWMIWTGLTLLRRPVLGDAAPLPP